MFEGIVFLNSFSLNMLEYKGCSVKFTPIDVGSTISILTGDFTSAIGHRDTAIILSNMLGIEIPYDDTRTTVKLKQGDYALVAQYTGSRLPEGSTSLPHGAMIQFWLVKVM